MAHFIEPKAPQQLKATMQKRNNMQTVLQAGALIGKFIQANQADGTSTTGAVTSVGLTTTNGVTSPTIQINGTDVDYSTITKVSSTPITTA